MKGNEDRLLAYHRELQVAQAELQDQGDNTKLWPLQQMAPDGSNTVDLSKADPDCKRCNGKGISDHRFVPGKGEVHAIPVVCRCVYARGGVALHLLLDRLKPPVKKRRRKPKRRIRRGKIRAIRPKEKKHEDS